MCASLRRERKEFSDLPISHAVIGRQRSQQPVQVRGQGGLPVVEEGSVVEDAIAAPRRMRRRQRAELAHDERVQLNELTEASLQRPSASTHSQLDLVADEERFEAAHSGVSIVGPRGDAASEEGVSESRRKLTFRKVN